MRSDPRVDIALAAVAPRRAAFRAAIAAARDQVATYLALHGKAHDRVAELGAELGRFAAGSVDAERLATLLPNTGAADAAAMHVVRRCVDVLDELLDASDELFVCDVQPGADLRASVFVSLGELGRAFGAVLAFRAAVTGRYDATRHAAALRSFPFALWNRAERAIGVPLVVRVAGADLCAEALAEYLDGQQQVVLVVEGPCAPAPLARLVSPGVLVLQTSADLGPLLTFDGPAIVALVPEGSAEFIADPRAGGAVVVHRDAKAPASAVGRWSVAQQREQVAVLRAMASGLPVQGVSRGAAETRSEGHAAPGVAASPRESNGTVAHRQSVEGDAIVGTLADWLLVQAGFATGAAR